MVAVATRGSTRMAKKGAAPRGGGNAPGTFQNLLAARDPYAKAQSGTTAQGGPAKYGGRVYALGPEGVDEYSPIYTPETFQTTGNTYAPGPLGLTVWAVGFSALLLV